jgi:hypothetical protein
MSVPPLQPGKLTLDELNRVVNAIETPAHMPGGAGVLHHAGAGGDVFSASSRRDDSYAMRMFRVTGNTPLEATKDANGNPTQWTYTVEEIRKATAGYGGWAARAGGYSGTAYNTDEDANTGTGRQMNSVDHDGANYPGGFEMFPLATGVIRPGLFVQTDAGLTEVWLFKTNGEDGTCS